MTQDFTFFKKNSGKTIQSNMLKDIFTKSQEREHWLFIAPHDDDVVLGSGLLLQRAIEEKVSLSVLITTDGQMGYANIEDREKIVQVRKTETKNSFDVLGTHEVEWLDFPDLRLTDFVGKRPAKDGDPCVIQGFTGLQNAFTYHFRKLQPTKIFIPVGSDLHPDHRIVYQEALISIFHAMGNIWLELGEPLKHMPQVYEMAIYCDFVDPANIKVLGKEKHLKKKIDAIRAYRSQSQIDLLVQNIAASGPVEYFRDLDFKLYSPQSYEGKF